jgi:hypothetical protein
VICVQPTPVRELEQLLAELDALGIPSEELDPERALADA